MNKDKVIKDLKERNDKLKHQYELLEIREIHYENENKQLKEDKRKAIEYIKNKKQFQKGCDIYQIIDWEYVLELLGDKE